MTGSINTRPVTRLCGRGIMCSASFVSPPCLAARCFSEESCLSLKQLEGYLVVLQPDAPQISLSGVGPHLARPPPEFEGPRGVPLFPELRIVCSLSHAVNTAAQVMEGGGESPDSPL